MMPVRSLRTLALLAALASSCVFADEAQEIGKLIKQGQSAQALDRANQFLAKSPRDAQVRFQKGLALVDLGKQQDAIKVFQALTEDFPELPEPYNNLAVLYAQQKQYDKARQALEMAIQTHPSYATAHENLGDIYAEMASQAYGKALSLDKGNNTARTKLTLIRDLFAGPAAIQTKPVAPAKPEVKPEPPKPETKPTPVKPVEPVASKPAETTKPVVKTEPKTEPVAPARDEQGVVRTAESWAKAWSDKKVSAYLGFYDKSFRPPRGMSRPAWEAERRDRLTAPKQIEVEILDPKVVFVNDNTARLTFSQRYHSDALNSTTGKTLVLGKAGDRWLIVEERVGR